MRVDVLQLQSFRNLQPLTLTPGPGLNVFAGDNAQGKTNLLEAVNLIGTLRSFRTSKLTELIAHGASEAKVSARVSHRELARRYDLTLSPAGKDILLDGKAPRSLVEYFGDLNVVLFAPEDLRVPRGSPTGRRRFLDRSVFNQEPAFLAEAQRYGRALKSRNALLRAERRDPALFEAYEAELARAGARIVKSRLRYLAEFEPAFAAAFEAITHTGLAATLAYETDPDTAAVAAHDESATRDHLAQALAAARPKDLARRQTSVGPHVDDVAFMLAGQPAKAFASQGQVRALVLAWKTAEMRLCAARRGDSPVLLLDDVSSELDDSRNKFLFDLVGQLACQCFVTTTHPRHVAFTENRLDFRVLDGVVTPADPA